MEGPPGDTPGLGLLDGHTVLRAPKITTRTRGEALGATVEGYEIHMGRTITALPPLLRVRARDGAAVDGEPDGAISADGRVLGTYLHGLLDAPAFLAALLARTGRGDFADVAALPSAAADKEAQDDRLADHLLSRQLQKPLHQTFLILLSDGNTPIRGDSRSKTRSGLLEKSFLTEKSEKLLRGLIAACGPESRSPAACHDHGPVHQAETAPLSS